MKRVYKKIYETVKKAVISGHTTPRLALAFCIGLYISFSPFPGFHTIMMVAFAWLFRLSLPVILLGAWLNNPWTMLPIYSLDYSLGYWIVHGFFSWNAPFVLSLGKIFGSAHVCLVSFLIGGNLLGVVAAVVGYPIALKIFEKITLQLK